MSNSDSSDGDEGDTKYGPEIIEVICRVISRTGSERRAIIAAGINQDTFYTWKREKSEFSDRVSAAHKAYAAHDDDAVTQAFRNGLLSAMKGTTEVHRVEETTTLPDGSQITKVSEKRTPRPPAEWAFRMAAPQVNKTADPDAAFGVTQQQLDFKNMPDDKLIAFVAGGIRGDGAARSETPATPEPAERTES